MIGLPIIVSYNVPASWIFPDTRIVQLADSAVCLGYCTQPIIFRIQLFYHIRIICITIAQAWDISYF